MLAYGKLSCRGDGLKGRDRFTPLSRIVSEVATFSDSIAASGFLLVITVAVIGVLHTAVPDHWAPIALIARQRAWSQRETALAAAQAGLGHVVTTLIIGLVVWIAGVQFAARFGNVVDTIASIA